jgi:short-subunit dehydrogenase
MEEYTPEEQFSQLNTNIIGAMNVTKAFLPYMRERKTGTVVWIGSVAGWAAESSLSLYSATKFAVRGTLAAHS